MGDVKVTQSCLTLCDAMNYIVHGILQARILEWVAISYSRDSSQPRNRAHIFYVSCTGSRILYQCAKLESSVQYCLDSNWIGIGSIIFHNSEVTVFDNKD